MTSRLKFLFAPLSFEIAPPLKQIDPDRFMPDIERRELTRRDFMQLLGTGLLIAITAETPAPQRLTRAGSVGQRVRVVIARVHIAPDGTITIMTGKVESGQDSRAEITSAAAEALSLPAERIQLLMADTALVPTDGTTPRTISAVRRGCAAARKLLLQLAAEQWRTNVKTLELINGQVTQKSALVTLSYADLANSEIGSTEFAGKLPTDIELTQLKDWRARERSAVRRNARDIVAGRKRHPGQGMVRSTWSPQL